MKIGLVICILIACICIKISLADKCKILKAPQNEREKYNLSKKILELQFLAKKMFLSSKAVIYSKRVGFTDSHFDVMAKPKQEFKLLCYILDDDMGLHISMFPKSTDATTKIKLLFFIT